ncbi:MAG TPA: tetratricopeptide repeat protein [Myxococcaceae bacterium]|nr:tetratricopeptide repeat protein [Myxococcaceae bacterium]
MFERPHILRRLLSVLPLCALAACATDSATQAEMAALRAELRSMREQQTRMGDRLERLERSTSVSRARNVQPPASTAKPSSQAPATPAGAKPGARPRESAVEVPDLTVVKLKPKNDPAPSLPTRVPVVEPDDEQAEMFVSASPESSEPAAEAMNIEALDAEFEKSMSALRTGNVELGVTKLQAFAEQYPRHPKADNALYFSGLGRMGLKDFATAATLFERLIETYPAGDAVLDGMLRLAECRVKLNQKDDARALYTRVITQFPGTAAATQAEQRLASLSP